MEFTFLKNGKVAFYRSDAEQAEWTQEEFSLFCTFPYNRGKVIERGMTVLFKDPATKAWQAYEIRNCTIFPGESYQQFTAEDIAVSELTDIHVPEEIQITDLTAKAALNKFLTDTGWKIGTDETTGKSSADIYRGSAWEGVTTVRNNWNINILTRVTVNASGITGRYLDLYKTNGTWRGLRLSVDKDCADPCVTYDDSELYTALYGYGASKTEGESIETQNTVELTFSGVAWSKTSDHPAKPSGQKYLEWPEKTKLYGRNGKPRFGYYQNTSIKDANTLLEKTWETLKNCSEPKISITGTVTDLYRMGYKDQPLRLYDMAIVDVGEFQFYKQVIKLTIDLLDETKNRPTIGDYIPNIIYINRETENYATGGSTGAGGRGGGGTRSQKKQGEFETDILQNERNIILEARQVDENREKLKAAGINIDPITGVVVYAEDVPNGIGANFHVMNNQISTEVYERKKEGQELTTQITQTSNAISLEVTNRKNQYSKLNAKIDVQANKISLVVQEKGERYVINTVSIVGGINADHGSYLQLNADTIDLSGYVTASQLAATNADITKLITGQTLAASIRANALSASSSFSLIGKSHHNSTITIDGVNYNIVTWS